MGPTPLWTLLVQSRQVMLSNHPVDLGIQWILYEDGHHLYLASRSRDDIFFSGTPRSDLWAVVTLVTAPCIASRKLLLIE